MGADPNAGGGVVGGAFVHSVGAHCAYVEKHCTPFNCGGRRFHSHMRDVENTTKPPPQSSIAQPPTSWLYIKK